MKQIFCDDARRPGRLLWNTPPVVALCAVSIVVTAAIVAWQMRLRSGLYDPDSIRIFERLFLFEDYPSGFIYALALLLALTPAIQRAGVQLCRSIAQHVGWCAIATFGLLAIGARLVYMARPIAMDESAQLMQSKIFASGELFGRLPPTLMDWLIHPSFQGYFIHVNRSSGEVASAYWPGFAGLLTPFTSLGMPWLCNPIIGALSVVVVYRLTLGLTQSSVTAGLSVLFTVASAAFVINAISFYSMSAHLLSNAVFALILLKPTELRAALAGFVGGIALTLHNPVPHLLFALPWVIHLLRQNNRWRLILALVAGYLPLVIVAGFGWHFLLQSLASRHAPAIAPTGFNPIIEAFRSIAQVLSWPTTEVLGARLIGLAKLWLWASPAMLLLAAVGAWRSRHNVHVLLLVSSLVLTFVGYLFVPVDQGHGWGFRYLHSAWFVLPALAAMALQRRSPELSCSPENGDMMKYASGAALCGLLLMVPLFSWRVHEFASAHHAQLPSTSEGRPRLLIINPGAGYYAQDLVQNDPFLRDPVIRMITRGRRADEEMIEREFPDLILLSRTYRGSVWGFKNAEAEH